MISAIKWIPRGAAKEFPEKLELDENEMNRISELAKMELDDANLDLDEAMAQGTAQDVDENDELDDAEVSSSDENVSENPQNQGKGVDVQDKDDDPMAKYNMDDYDDEPNNSSAWNTIANVRGLAHYAVDEKDEHLAEGDDDEEERQELQILPTDNLILAAKTEDDVSMIECYVYDDSGDTDTTSLYVHHDFMLPSFPLCVEWLPYKVGSSADSGEGNAANMVAIGTFDPEIEIWNLDVVDAVYPAAILGQRPKDAKIEAKGTGKKKRQLKKAHDEYHVDAVLALSNNSNHVNLLASASADCTVKLWDLATTKAIKSFNIHDSKVSCVKWNPIESTVLLTGGYDHQAIVSDLRIESNDGSRKYKIEGDVESIQWHPNGINFFVGTDRGQVYKFDARMENQAVWTLHAHDEEITSFDINSHIPEFMITGSADKQVKLWNLADDKPSMLLSRNLDVGRVFSVGFAPDNEVRGMVAVGGSDGKMKVWNSFSNKAVRQVMGKNYNWTGTNEQVITANDDNEPESDNDMDDE